MQKKPIDRSKKSNIYCGHCEYWTDYPKGWMDAHCKLTDEVKEYWNRCKNFEWAKDGLYLDKQS